jgi:hypothetical protein
MQNSYNLPYGNHGTVICSLAIGCSHSFIENRVGMQVVCRGSQSDWYDISSSYISRTVKNHL